MESKQELYDRAYSVGAAAYRCGQILSNPYFNPVMRQGFDDGYFQREKKWDTDVPDAVGQPTVAQVEADASIDERYTITRAQLLGCSEHAINSVECHYEKVADHEKYRIRSAAATIDKVAYGRWWDEKEQCGCLIGTVYGRDPVGLYSPDEARVGLRFDELLGEVVQNKYELTDEELDDVKIVHIAD